MQFSYPVTNVEYILPFVSASIIFLCSFLSIYMYKSIISLDIKSDMAYAKSSLDAQEAKKGIKEIARSKESIYLIVFAISIVGIFISIGFGLMAVIGKFKLNMRFGMEVWRILNISTTTLLIIMPLYTRYAFSLSKTLNSLLDKMIMVYIVVVPLIILVAFVRPDLFVSVSVQDPAGERLIRESSYARGISGIAFDIQNILISFTILVVAVCMFYNISKSRSIVNDIIPTIGIIAVLIGGAEDLLTIRTNSYMLFPNLLFSRSAITIAFFIMTIMIKLFKQFIDNAIEFKNNQNEMMSKYSKDMILAQKLSVFSESIKGKNEKLSKYSKNLINSANKSVNIVEMAEAHVGRSHVASSEFLSISKMQKNTVEDINAVVNELFESLYSISSNIESQRSKIASSIDNITLLTNTIDSMRYTINQIVSIASNLEEYTVERKKNILGTFEKLENVEQISKEVFQTINFIKDIAERTNLLAINADIHASKAGIVGRGFSVVSHEIGTLSASSHIGIEHVETLLTHMAQTLESVNEIKSYVYDSFDEIVKKVKNIAISIGEIVESIKKQTEDNDIIKQDIERLNSTTDMIVESVRIQDEYSGNIKNSINSMLMQFDLINDKSSLQIADIDSIKNSIETIDDNLHSFFDYSKELYLHSMSITKMNEELGRQLSKVAYIQKHIQENKDLDADGIKNEGKLWFDDSKEVSETDTNTDSIDYTNVQDSIDSLIEQYKQKADSIKNENIEYDMDPIDMEMRNFIMETKKEKNHEEERKDEINSDGEKTENLSAIDIEMNNFLEEARRLEEELDIESQSENEIYSSKKVEDVPEKEIEKIDDGEVDIKSIEESIAIEKAINEAINSYIETETARLQAIEKENEEKEETPQDESKYLPSSSMISDNDKNINDMIQNYINESEEKAERIERAEKVKKEKTAFEKQNDILTDEYISDLDAALNKALEEEKLKNQQ